MPFKAKREAKRIPVTEFHDKNGKPWIYCYGYEDRMGDEPLDECKNCLDWAYGEQMEKDFEKNKKELMEELC